MKRLIVILLLLTLSGLTAYAMSHEKAPMAKGDAVITYITKTNPYQQWALWPGKGKLYKGGSSARSLSDHLRLQKRSHRN